MTFIVAQFFALSYWFFTLPAGKISRTDPVQNVEDIGLASFLGQGWRVTGMTCFMIGHRDAPESIIPTLKQTVERLIVEYRVTEYVVGHYGAFDRMAARAVREAKQTHPDVKLVLLLPYYQSDATSIENGCDGTIYPDGQETVPKRATTVRANKYMIANCDFLICYQCHIGSNVRDFVEYARKLYQRTGKPYIVNLAELMP